MILIRRYEDLQDKKITVMGLGLNGGGLASCQFLAEAGAKVTATDLRSRQELEPTLKKLKKVKGKYPIQYVLGEHRTIDFSEADIVIKNPAIRKENPFLNLAKQIETDITLFLRFCKNPIIAVTGSKGKSTTVSILDFILKKTLSHSFLGGNITRSPLTFLKSAQKHPQAPVVLELSSWQLADIKKVEAQYNEKIFHPQITLITNIMNDHQNAYNQFSDYVADKEIIFENQTANDIFIAQRDCWGKSFSQKTKAHSFLVEENPISFTPALKPNTLFLEEDLTGWIYNGKYALCLVPSQLAVAGIHSRYNCLKAAAIAWLFGIEAKKILKILPKFKGLAYRMELVCTRKIQSQQGTTRLFWVNDSAATMPDAMLASCNSFQKPIYLITGGTDKALEFSPYQALPSNIKQIFFLEGTATEKMMQYIPARWREKSPPPFSSMEAIIDATLQAIKKESPKEAVILLSPGAASFGLFKNEFDRGDQFAALAKRKK